MTKFRIPILLLLALFSSYMYANSEKFTFSDGSTLTNLYRSDGTMYGRTEREKVMSTVSGGSSSSYTFKTTGYTFVGDFVVEDYTPAKMYFNGGYIDLFVTAPTSVTTSYKYYVHDNQGSVRAVVNQSGALVQAADYSAYGVPSTRYRMTADNRLHLGLEWQPMKGLYGYYNNARFRDALLAGMFFQIDPLAEKYYPFSPYHYAAANPLRFTDPTGQWIIGNDNKAVTYTYNDKGAIQWSNNMRNDTKIVLDAMMRTTTGTKQVKTMLHANHPILIFTTDIEGFGNTRRTYTTFHKKGSDITITRANIEINIHDIKAYGDIDTELKNLSTEDRIGTVGVHESEHATNPQAISNARDDKSSKEAEKIANRVTYQHLEELKNKQTSNH